MEWLLQTFDNWAADEDDKVMGTMAKLYGPLLQYALVFPSWKRSNLKVTLGLFALFLFAIPLHFLILGVSSYKLKDDFALASMVFHYFLIIGLVQMVAFEVNRVRRVLARTHRMMAVDMGNYRTGRIYDEKKPRVYEKNKKKELMQFLCLPGGVIITAAGSVIIPYAKKLIEEKSGDEAHYTTTGVNLNMPVVLYYPFPTHSGILHVAGVLGQVTCGAALSVMIGTMELLMFRLSQSITFEFRVLQHGVQSVSRHARRLYEQTHPGRSTDGLCAWDTELQDCIGLCLNDCIAHHQQISRLCKLYEAIVKWPAALTFGIGTAVIGLSLINILDAKETKNYENLALFTVMMTMEVLNMYMVTIFGENITTESKILRDVLYEVDWHKMNGKNRKVLVNFQIGVTNPVIVKAGGLVDLSMDTFSSIMNMSYSFFNLVNVGTK